MLLRSWWHRAVQAFSKIHGLGIFFPQQKSIPILQIRALTLENSEQTCIWNLAKLKPTVSLEVNKANSEIHRIPLSLTEWHLRISRAVQTITDSISYVGYGQFQEEDLQCFGLPAKKEPISFMNVYNSLHLLHRKVLWVILVAFNISILLLISMKLHFYHSWCYKWYGFII